MYLSRIVFYSYRANYGAIADEASEEPTSGDDISFEDPLSN
jgi:hypothetical protein